MLTPVDQTEKILRAGTCISDLQRLALKLHGTYDLEKSLLWLTEELGELVAGIRKRRSPDHVSGELGDVLIWVINISNTLNFDLETILDNSFKKEHARQIKAYGRLKYWPSGDVNAVCDDAFRQISSA